MSPSHATQMGVQSNAAFIEQCLQHLERTGDGDKAAFLTTVRTRKQENPKLWTKKVAILCGQYLKALKGAKRVQDQRRAPTVCAGTLYQWGTIVMDEEDGIISQRTESFPTFHSMKPSVRFLHVACGGSFMMACTPGGSLFVMGNNGFGQLAMPQKQYNTLIEHDTMRIDDSSNCGIFCGYSFSFVRNQSRVFATGCGADGRLGNGSEEDIHQFELMNWEMDAIACGSVSCTGIDTEGRLFSWGKSEYTGTRVATNILRPVPILSLYRFHSVSCGIGGYHFLAVTRAGQLYSWGHNRVGQLGRDYDIDHYLERLPKPVDVGNALVVDAKAGWGHSVVQLERGKVLTCGRNHQGQLGKDPATCPTNSRGHHMSPVLEQVDVPPVKQVELGGEITTVMTEDGEVYWWGFCPTSLGTFHAPMFVPQVVHVPGTVQSLTCSSFAMFAIVSSDQQ